MGRYGPLTCVFYDADDFTTQLSDSASNEFIYPLTARTNLRKGTQSETEVVAPMTSDWDDLIQQGHVCAIYYTDSVMAGEFSTGVPFCPPFRITEVMPTAPKAAPGSQVLYDTITFRGADLLDELKGKLTFNPIATLNNISTTIATFNAVTVTNTTVLVGAPANNDNVILTSVTNVDVGDEIRIVTNQAGVTHVTKVTSVNPPASPAGSVQIRDRMPYNADAGKAVEIRTANIRVADTTDLVEGLPIWVTMNSAVVHKSFIEAVDENEKKITMTTGMNGGANIGNAVVGKDWSEPAMDDVDQIMSLAPDWSTEYDSGAYVGTAQGSRHANEEGATAFDLLAATQRQTGETFRLDVSSAAGTVIRRVRWIRTPAIAGNGSNQRLVMPAQSAADSDGANVNRGIIAGEVVRRHKYNPISRIYPFAGDDRITLYDITGDAAAYILLYGYTLVTSGLGDFEPPYIKDTAIESNPEIGIRAIAQSFSNVRAESDKIETIQSAADALVYEAVNFLFQHQQSEEYYTVNEVVCGRPIYPGDRIELVYTEPNNLWSISKTAGNSLYVLGVTRTYGDDGIVYSSFELSTTPYDEATVSSAAANTIRSVEQVLRIAGGAASIFNIIGGTTGTPGVTDHGALTGLGDDDHTQYVRTSGDGDGLLYNATIRGFDIDLATNSGLLISSTKLQLNTPGTISASTTNTVGPNHTHGVAATSDGESNVSTLLMSSAGGRLRLDGLSLNTSQTSFALEIDGGINYRGGNNIFFSGAASATIQNTSQTISVLAGGLILDPGDATLQLDADITFTNAARTIRTNTGNITLDPASGTQVIDANISLTGGPRTISTDANALKLAPAGELELDSTANVIRVLPDNALYRTGFSSGFLGTGWGIQYDGTADFRFLRADELHVMSFIADIARVSVGANYVTPSMAELSRELTIPAVSSTTTLYVNDVPGFPDTQAFYQNDWVMLRIVDRSGGGLGMFLVWGQVTNYTDLSGGEQSWTFTTRSANAAAVGETAGAGLIALDFGKSGNGWWWATAIGSDSPYMGITTWHGTDPYTEANRKHRIRVGQLVGVTGNYEWGMLAGVSNSNRALISDLRSELHGTRLSLYSNDNAELRVQEAELRFTYNGGSTADRLPDSDVSSLQAASTGGSYYTQISDGYDTPGSGSYVRNEGGKSAEVWLGFVNPPSWTTLNSVAYRIRHAGSGFTDDNCQLFIQVFRSDGMTPLTSEELVINKTDNSSAGTGAISFSYVDEAVAASVWNSGRIRLRWEYNATTTPESIRLDPFVPSIAVGASLPTGITAGGNGFWAGRNGVGGAYQMRMGDPSGVRFQWTGTAMEFYNAANTKTIAFDSSGDGYFAGVMNIGTSGGIWQGNAGSFASPTNGIKLFNSGGIGVLRAYNSGTIQAEINTSGNLTAGGGNVVMNALGLFLKGTNEGSSYSHVSSSDLRINFQDGSGTTVSYIAGLKSSSAAHGVRIGSSAGNDHLTLYAGLNHRWVTGSGSAIELQPGSAGVRVAGDLFIESSGLVVGPNTTAVNTGQIVSDIEGASGWQAMIFIDTTDVAHGITTIAGTTTYGRLGKISDTNGGFLVDGFTEGQVGLQLQAYATTVGTNETTNSNGTIRLEAFKKSGTGVTDMAADDNIMVVANNINTKFIFKGNGDLYVDGASTLQTYDEYDDARLVRALALQGDKRGLVRTRFDEWVQYNKSDLVAAGLISDGGFRNVTGIQELLGGAVWQIWTALQEALERIDILEARLAV